MFSWAHGALSALADRIKIARNAVGDDINLSIQWVLNCGSGASTFITVTSYFVKKNSMNIQNNILTHRCGWKLLGRLSFRCL